MNVIQVAGGQLKIPVNMGGGVEAFILAISKQLSIMGHNVIVLDRKYTSADPVYEHNNSIRIVRLKARRLPRLNITLGYVFNQLIFILQVKKFLMKNKSDVIHVHDTIGGFILSLISKQLRKKLIYTCHSSYLSSDSGGPYDKFIFSLQNKVVKWVAKVTVPNEFSARHFIKAGFNLQKVAVIPRDVDVNLFTPDISIGDVRQKYAIEDGKKIILSVGAVTQRKGAEYLIRAANIIICKHRQERCLFLIVGPAGGFNAKKKRRTPYLNKLLNLIKSCNLENSVRLTDAVPLDDLRRLYAICDIVALPTLADIPPRAIAEAMAMGKPVIATNVGGIDEQVEDEKSGFLIEPANEAELADKIEYLLNNPMIAKEMGAYGRKLAEEKFSSIKVAERFIQVYQEVINQA